MRASDRPALLAVVMGADDRVDPLSVTELTIAIVRGLRSRSIAAVARKPIETYDPSTTRSSLRLAMSSAEPADSVCGWSLPLNASPLIAAHRLGMNLPSVGRLFADTHFHPATQVGVIEACGSPCTPVGSDGDNLDLLAGFDPDLVIIVADAAHALEPVLVAGRLLDGWKTWVLLARFEADNAAMVEQRVFLESRHHLFTDVASVVEQLGLWADHESRLGA